MSFKPISSPVCHEGIGPNIRLDFAIIRARVEKSMAGTVFSRLNGISIGLAVNQAQFLT